MGTGQTVGTGAATGAASGAAMGSMAGPWGALAGGVLGGIGGALGGMGQARADKAAKEAIAAQEQAIRQEMTRRAQGVGEVRQTFGDVWGFAGKGVNEAGMLKTGGGFADAQDPSKFQDLTKTIARHGEQAGVIEGQASATRDAGMQNLADTAQQAKVGLKGSIASRGLLGSSLSDSAKQALLGQYAGNRAGVGAAVEGVRDNAWGGLHQQQAQLEQLAQSGGNLAQQQTSNAQAATIAGARAQMPAVAFGNLLNTGIGMTREAAQAEAKGGAGWGGILPGLGSSGGAMNRAKGATTSGGV